MSARPLRPVSSNQLVAKSINRSASALSSKKLVTKYTPNIMGIGIQAQATGTGTFVDYAAKKLKSITPPKERAVIKTVARNQDLSTKALLNSIQDQQRKLMSNNSRPFKEDQKTIQGSQEM